VALKTLLCFLGGVFTHTHTHTHSDYLPLGVCHKHTWSLKNSAYVVREL